MRKIEFAPACSACGTLTSWLTIASVSGRSAALRWRAVLSETIADGQRAGELPASVQPDQVALMLASLMDGLAVQFALGDVQVTAERMTDTLLFAAERGLGCELTPYRQAVAGVAR